MKNILTTVVSIILGVFFFIVVPGIGGYIDTHYVKENCEIVEITEDFVVAVDAYDKTSMVKRWGSPNL